MGAMGGRFEGGVSLFLAREAVPPAPPPDRTRFFLECPPPPKGEREEGEHGPPRGEGGIHCGRVLTRKDALPPACFLSRYTWPEGAEYEGAVHQGRRHGAGTLTFSDSESRYEGEWNNGLREGKGKLSFDKAGAAYYDGAWLNDMRHGHGVMVYPSGNFYEGELQEGEKSGHGKMVWLKGQTYVGEWARGKPNGRGEFVYGLVEAEDQHASHFQQQNRYVGEFVNGLRHGKGTFHYATGASYSGDWEYNVKSGEGTFVYEDGSVYMGPFRNDRRVADLTASPGAKMTLEIDDLLFEEEGPDLAYKAVQNLLLRYNSELRAIYRRYGGAGDDAAAPGASLSLGAPAMMRLCKDCRIPCRVLPLARLEKLVDAGDTSPELKGVLLFRNFLQILVRIAHIRYHDMPRLERRLHHLLNNNILPHAHASAAQAAPKLPAGARGHLEAVFAAGSVGSPFTFKDLLRALKANGALPAAFPLKAALAFCLESQSIDVVEGKEALSLDLELNAEAFLACVTALAAKLKAEGALAEEADFFARFDPDFVEPEPPAPEPEPEPEADPEEAEEAVDAEEAP